jgi:hypothetical protein
VADSLDLGNVGDSLDQGEDLVYSAADILEE